MENVINRALWMLVILLVIWDWIITYILLRPKKEKKGWEYSPYLTVNEHRAYFGLEPLQEEYVLKHVVFQTRMRAEEILNSMVRQINNEYTFTVADYYRQADVPTNFRDANYCWRSLAGVWVKSERNSHSSGTQYYIDLPMPTRFR